MDELDWGESVIPALPRRSWPWLRVLLWFTLVVGFFSACGPGTRGPVTPGPESEIAPADDRPDLSAAATAAPTPSPSAATPAPSIDLSPTDVPSHSTEPASSAQQENLPYPTVGPLPGTPFAPSGGYLLHQVRPGESLASIATAYQLSADLLIAANPKAATGSLWAGALLVVPLGGVDGSQPPAFEVYYTTRAWQIDSLAGRFGVSPAELRTYNGLGPGPALPAGRWLILPVPP